MSHESSRGTKLLYCLICNLMSCILTPNYLIYKEADTGTVNSMTSQIYSYLISNILHNSALEGHYQVSVVTKIVIKLYVTTEFIVRMRSDVIFSMNSVTTYNFLKIFNNY